MPPPTHMVTTPYLAPRRLPSIRMWPVMRAPVDVEALVGDAEPIPAIQYLDSEGFVEFPDVDVVHLEPVLLEQLRHGEYRPDAHLVGVAAGDRDAAIGAERIEAAALGFLGLHQHGRRGAV